MTEPQPRRLEYIDVETLQSAIHNPKLHDDEGIVASMDRFGYIEPIVMDERTQRLISGHGRVAAIQAMRTAGQSAPEGVVVRRGHWQVPVMRGWASRSDADAEAAGIALNQLPIRGGFNEVQLVERLRELDQQNMLEAAAFAREDLEALMQRTGVLAAESMGFLGDLLAGERPAHMLEASGEAQRVIGVGISELRLPMSTSDRDECVLLLRRLKVNFGGDVLGATLLAVLRHVSASAAGRTVDAAAVETLA